MINVASIFLKSQYQKLGAYPKYPEEHATTAHQSEGEKRC